MQQASQYDRDGYRVPAPRQRKRKRAVGADSFRAGMDNPRRRTVGGQQRFNWVDLDQSEFESVQAFFEFNDLLFACHQKLQASTTGRGLSLELQEFEQKVRLDEQHEEWVKDELLAFSRDFLLNAFLFGVVVVRLAPSDKYPGEITPYVVPWRTYELSFYEGSQVAGRRYYVEFNDAPERYSETVLPDGTSIQDNEVLSLSFRRSLTVGRTTASTRSTTAARTT